MRGIKRNVWKESSEINSRYISKGYKYNTPEHAAKPNVASTLHSGRIADAMGEIIADLSQTMQVVDITHLPQVASKGDTHFVVYKDAEGPLFPVCQYLYKADYSLTQESTNFTDLQSRAMDFPSKPTVQAFRHRKSFRNGLPYPLWKFPFRKIRSKPFHPTPANKNISAYAVFYASVKSFSQRVRLMNRRVVKTDRICKKRN